MAKQFPSLEPQHVEFIARQHMYFTASAAESGHVNLSPKGLDSFRVLGPRSVFYLDLTGSGAETAAHSRRDGRLTVMFCAFEGPPLILRLYGQSRIVLRGTDNYQALLAEHFGGDEPPGARAMVMLEVDLVQTSCGFGVPTYQFAGHRPTLTKWAEAREEKDGLESYRRQKNRVSMDGFPTGLVPEGW